jgi:chemotaxis protein methyltransferase CheR
MAQTVRRTDAAYAPGELSIPDQQLEFAFSEADFRGFVQLAYQHAGISLSDSKRNLVYSRLSRRLRALGMTSFLQYREYLDSGEGKQEVVSFINAISTNLTKFFRESHHFEHLQSHVAVPYAQAANRRANSRLRIWSAGCSTGEEPYTIAAVLKREIRHIEQHDVRILATDIDTEVLSKAARGEYPLPSIEDVPNPYRQFFPVMKGGKDDAQIVIDESTRSLIAFRRLNLMEPWPFRGLFDAIFCRNVMIYFDGPTKSRLIDRFTQQIKPGGWLYIGHSESLIGLHPGLDLVGRTTYRRDP